MQRNSQQDDLAEAKTSYILFSPKKQIFLKILTNTLYFQNYCRCIVI